MIDIPSPSEVAERNRIKDEAADDELLEEWLPVARQHLMEYRGCPCRVALPGVVIDEEKYQTTVHSLDRFERLIREAFAGTDWEVKIEMDTIGQGNSYWHAFRFATFGSISQRERKEREEEERKAERDRKWAARDAEMEAAKKTEETPTSSGWWLWPR